MIEPEEQQNRVDATPEHRAPLGRGLTAIDGAMSLVAVLLVVQMWLLTTTLQLDLAGHRGVALPAVLVSAVLFAGCFVMYLFIEGVDVRVRRGSEGGPRPPAG